MGNFTIHIEAVGGHGCDRATKDNESRYFPHTAPDANGCPDCIAKRAVEDLKKMGCQINVATLTHWPDQPCELVDNLDTGLRKGQF